MSTASKVLLGLGMFASACLLLIVFNNVAPSKRSNPSADTPERGTDTALQPVTSLTAVSESNQILEPYDLSKNPYRWQGQTGILDTVHVSMPMPNGQTAHIPYPGGGLRLEKMIDAHTATFSVLVGGMDISPEGEIAVLLPDSEPPTPSRPWRVAVEGPMEGFTALGAKLQITAITFRGYYIPPAPAVVPTNTPDPPTPATRTAAAPDEEDTSDRVSSASNDEKPSEEGVRHIGGSVSAPVVLFSPEPEIPEQAKKDRASGSVLVYLQVDKMGNPKNVRVLRGLGPELDESALAAVRQYRFKAAMEDGHPVPVEMNVSVGFQVF